MRPGLNTFILGECGVQADVSTALPVCRSGTSAAAIDEPFGALDPLTRNDIQKEFKSLQQRLNKTVVFVTHDVTEAMLLGTRIALMDEGRLLGVYSPPDFLRSPDPVVSGYVAVLRAGLEIAQLQKGGL